MPHQQAWQELVAKARWVEPKTLHGPVLALVPHADDETLGFGGLLAELQTLGVEVDLVLVTDGGASHMASNTFNRVERCQVREAEFNRALDLLGHTQGRRRFWRKPDARLGQFNDAEVADIFAELDALHHEGHYATVLTPWRRDPHGDHEAIAAWTLAWLDKMPADERPELLEYCVWLGHQGSSDAFPAADPANLIAIQVEHLIEQKVAALQAHRSQLGLVFDDPEGFQIPTSLIASVLRPNEYFLQS